MGLCKCPKRKVTNLFCFEHRVNVCEHCLVANHPQCIVKSYLQWLQDSDYSPLCTLCNRGLSDEECGECVRLSCYDVFHWSCLNQYAQQFPAHTAPAGYTCPLCNSCIFPQTNLASPVADALRSLLKQVNWARAGLGLPLIEESEAPLPPPPSSQSATSLTATSNGQAGSQLRSDATLGYVSGLGVSPAPNSGTTTSGGRPSAQVAPYLATPPGYSSNQHSVISVDEGTSVRGQDRFVQFTNPRKLFDTTKDDDVFQDAGRSHDHDEDKYKRRPALQWLARWFNSIDGQKKKDPNAVRKRFAVVLLLGIIGFITIIIIFSKLGRQATEDDPFFDPMANPNIKVEKEVLGVQ
ncbi:zinc finger protein-like 1 homolog [Aplysia californica]|uniref:Zinc finger protein-like 1 homolog n=1 Tax=Aplysia californica TaxID=6500 RepID=A0ABM0JUM6_APLCA|nr:zinc finger protein-like 1 homolog [Aplysia californica]